MNKKQLTVMALAIVLALGLTACGSSGGTAGGSGSAGSESKASGTTYALSVGHTTAANENDPYYLTVMKFKEIVEQKTEGRITVNDYPSSQLGSEPEMWEGMQTGTCDMAIMTNAYVSSYVPANGALDLPFIFSDLKQAREVLDGDYGQKLIDNTSSTGVTCLAFSEGGFRQLCTRDKAVTTPADLKGLKIRCMETKTYLAAYSALGVNATPMAWGELLTALQQGTVDGCDAPLSVLYTNGFPDVCKYIDNVNLYYSPLPICISTQVFDTFSAEDQQILRDAAAEAASYTRSNNDSTAQKMEDDLTSKGMTIVSESEVDADAFREAVKPCYEQMESYIGTDWVKNLESLVGMA